MVTTPTITGRVLSPSQIKEAGFLCSTSASPAVTNHEFALRTKSETIQSVLDTGATRHFTGIKSDINQLKRWSKPEIVYVANGSTTKAISYRTMELPISHGTLLLHNI